MITTYSMFISLRQFFGFLVPGIAWLLILNIFFLEKMKIIFGLENMLQDKMFLYVFLLILGYFIGIVSTQIAWRILAILGDIVDSLVGKIRNKYLKTTFIFFSERFHIFNLSTLSEELRKIESSLDKSNLPLSYKADHFDSISNFCKMYVLENSSILGKGSLEIEGEIGFYAGMFFPSLTLSIILFPQSWFVGMIFILITMFFALRFQHLRHDGIHFVFQAFSILRLNKSD
ncbi:hypothetical protein ACFL36_01290 [Thermodesulfobacteriota bacterium]